MRSRRRVLVIIAATAVVATGLGVALGAMGLFVVLLWIKIRRLERSHGIEARR